MGNPKDQGFVGQIYCAIDLEDDLVTIDYATRRRDAINHVLDALEDEPLTTDGRVRIGYIRVSEFYDESRGPVIAAQIFEGENGSWGKHLGGI